MKTYETRAQYLTDCTDVRANSHMPPAGDWLWVCDCCGKAAPRSEPNAWRGHAFLCYRCADALQREDMRDRGRPFGCYLSGDGRSVTTWTGGHLGTVVGLGVARSGFHGSEQAFFRVRDTHGAWWSGRGPGRGMYATLRPMRDPNEKRPPVRACVIDVFSPWGTGRAAYRILSGGAVVAENILSDSRGLETARARAFEHARRLGFNGWRDFASASRSVKPIPTV